MIPTEKVVWIANTYTTCCNDCRAQFLADNPDLIKRHLKILGVDIPEARDTLLKLAAMVL